MSLDQAYGSASIALNTDKIDTLLSTIHTELIEKAEDEIRKAIDGLKSEIDTYWVGYAADAYKNYLDSTYDVLEDNLDDLMDQIEDTIEHAEEGVTQADEDSADAIRRLEDSL